MIEQQSIAIETNVLQQAYAETDAGAGRFVDDIQERVKFEQGLMVVERIQDVQPYLDANQRQYNEVSSWRPFAGRNMRLVADIPMIVVEQWMREGFNLFDDSHPSHSKELRRRLNDIENRKLRVEPGRI